jgi:hypothetical protein
LPSQVENILAGLKLIRDTSKEVPFKSSENPNLMAIRLSPIGYPEFKSTKLSNPDSVATTRADWDGVPYTHYLPEGWDDPDTQTHERIHQGQFASNLRLAPKDVLNAIAPGGFAGVNPFELPAYAFSAYKPKQQTSYNNYMDLVNAALKDATAIVQAPMPLKYQEGYIQRGPAVPVRYPTPDTVDLILGNLLKRK